MGESVDLGNSRSESESNADLVKNIYDLYKERIEKKAKSAADDKSRLASFNETLNAIANRYGKGDKSLSLNLNELDQLRGPNVPEDGSNPMNTKSDDRPARREEKVFTSKADSTSRPTSFDFTARVVSGTQVPVIQPVKNQGSCGSCYAFAFVTLLEFQFAVQLKSERNLSEQQIVDCDTIDKGCNGGYFTNIFKIQNNQRQIDGKSSYPYRTRTGTCVSKGINGGGGVKFGSLLSKRVIANATAMQESLIDYVPLVVTLFAGNDSTSIYRDISREIQSYKSGILQFSGCPTNVGLTNHAVVIVGYDVDSTTKTLFWKVRNN